MHDGFLCDGLGTIEYISSYPYFEINENKPHGKSYTALKETGEI